MRKKYVIKRIDGESILYHSGYGNWTDSLRKASRYPDTKYFRSTVKQLQQALPETQLKVVEIIIQEGPELVIE